MSEVRTESGQGHDIEKEASGRDAGQEGVSEVREEAPPVDAKIDAKIDAKRAPAPGDAGPILLRRRSGRTAALVIAGGFGGGTLLLGVGGALLSPMPGRSILPALTGYLLATLPLFLLAGIIALCRSDLWLDPEVGRIRLLTYRPWLLRPRVEEAPVSEYAGVRTDPAPEEDGGGILVSLVTAGGENVPLRQFRAQAEAGPYAEQVASSAGLWLRHGTGEPEPAGG